MNNSPFELYSTTHGNHVVHWPTFKNIRDVDTRIKLLDVLFKEVQCFEVGLGILLQGGDMDTLWIDFSAWAQNPNHSYSEYLMDMYEIRGVVFRNKNEAEQFQNILEKKYIWKVLKA
jgi:hypothetical protein